MERAYRHLPPPTIGHYLSMHIRGYRNAHHRPPTSPAIAPHFFRNARHIKRHRADGGGMTGEGCGRGLATARFGWCDWYANSRQIDTRLDNIDYTTED